MKLLASLSLGALSSALLSVGLNQAAQLLDPNRSHQSMVSADEPTSTLACDPPCYLLRS